MNKIYNNLSIENLIKTEWFNQFNEEQQVIIKVGLYRNIDVSIYAKLEYTGKQMYEIMEGLVANLDVSWYANPLFNVEQM